MDLENNGLSSIIPTWFGEGFSYLRILILRSNAFSGELPSKISKISSLQVLDLARNDLTDRIPASLGDLKAISQEQNKITYLQYKDGTFGVHYSEETLVVYANGEGQMTTFEVSSFVGNPGLCGPPLLVKCSGDVNPSHDDSNKGGSNDDHGLIDNWFY
ncbi:Leucine-rich repeat [Sesbania bispinosa]|nr:Leucine-rich repeat [Sesbania bispinosa]